MSWKPLCRGAVWRVGWVEDGEEGHVLGEGHRDPDDAGILRACRAVEASARGRDEEGFWWDSPTTARRAAKSANAADAGPEPAAPTPQWDDTAERLRADLRAAQWECVATLPRERWRDPARRRVLPLGAAWERARADAEEVRS